MLTQYLPLGLYLTRAIKLFFHEHRHLNSTETLPLGYVIQKGEDLYTITTINSCFILESCMPISKEEAWQQVGIRIHHNSNYLCEAQERVFQNTELQFVPGFPFAFIGYALAVGAHTQG